MFEFDHTEYFETERTPMSCLISVIFRARRMTTANFGSINAIQIPFHKTNFRRAGKINCGRCAYLIVLAGDDD